MKNFFKGLSFSQLFAGALAAVTSFLLSSKIGLAGSVIAVVVSSLVSATSSQVYKNILEESGKKLLKKKKRKFHNTTVDELDKENTQDLPAVDDKTTVLDAATDENKPRSVKSTPIIETEHGEKSSTPGAHESDETTVLDKTSTLDKTSVLNQTTALDKTAVLNAGKNGQNAAHGSTKPTQHAAGVKGLKGAKNGKLSALDRARKAKRMGIIVAVASSLVAVGITAALVLMFTGGKGTDTVVRDAITPTQTPTQTVTPQVNESDLNKSDQKTEPTQKPTHDTKPTPEPSSSPSPSSSSSAKPTPEPSSSPSPTDTKSPSPAPTPTETPSPAPTADGGQTESNNSGANGADQATPNADHMKRTK
ncbi:hypothetical protein D2E26_0674 [Bifidobacterium dolichotidis]|uniref:Uncharacterized protein n=1 Tax=Bifidobacterium dolichotidis TaxID=2306976 RepID=A0A430FTC7_9BIFI|nr:hypothetical protein [Bifidobacterium dolichotidis]RSX56111.1 hypothetical protein D2E26_0674 [Bifidobacterium dolichotidis]